MKQKPVLWSSCIAVAIVAAAVVGFFMGQNPWIVDQAADTTSSLTEQIIKTAHAAGGVVKDPKAAGPGRTWAPSTPSTGL
jgi:hypothetical protein